MMASNDNTNLLKETLRAIQSNTNIEVSHCIYFDDYFGQYCSFTFEEFIELAKDLDYYAGYGGQEIDATLRIYFKDGSYLYRKEYDGSEWWEYEQGPPKVLIHKKPESLKVY
jgi:hypothetical protein